MELMDDHGRILGVINIVDALAVLLVAVIVVAGIAFVTQPDEQPEPEEPETTTRVVTLQVTDVQPYLSDAIQTGMTETVDGETAATVTDVERAPSKLVVTDQNGTVHVRDHPFREDITITAELETRENGASVTFKGHTLQIGSTVVLDLGNVTFEATVTEL